MINRTILFLALFIFSFISWGQNSRIGDWKSWLPHNKGVWVTQSENKVIFSTGYGILTIDKVDASLETISRVDGLSGVITGPLIFDSFSQNLLLSYNDGNIDIVNDDEIKNLNYISDNTSITGNKKVNNLRLDGAGKVYLAMDFGLVQVNMDMKVFGFTLFTPYAVKDVCVHEGYIYLTNGETIYRAPDNADFPHSDLSQWENIRQFYSFPESENIAITSWKDDLYIGVDSIVYKEESGVLIEVYKDNESEINYLYPGITHLFSGWECIGCYNKIIAINETGNSKKMGSNCHSNMRNLIETEDGRFFFGDVGNDISYSDAVGNWCAQLSYDGPKNGTVFDLEVFDSKIYITDGRYNNSLASKGVKSAISIHDEMGWKIFDWETVPEFEAINMRDIVAIKKHPNIDRVYYGSYQRGLLVSENDEWAFYNTDNSPLEYKEFGTPTIEVAVSEMDFDSEDNLWMINYLTNEQLVVYRSDGSWQSFKVCGPIDALKIIVDDYDNKWISFGNSTTGLIVFNENDPNNPDDDDCRVFNQSNSALTTNKINTLEKDLNGDIWVGTDEGPVVFECGSDVLAEFCRGSRRKVEIDGIPDYLLQYEDILAIGVDGANRKWFGSRNGVFLVSSSGTEELARYNVSNSPLLHNQVHQVEVNQSTGEIFFGTENGLQSLLTDATHTTPRHTQDVIVYPNPVRPDYVGPIAIRGLARDALVRITDVQGRLVYETNANGGQAIWDGTDYNSNRSATGIYLVFSSSEGTEFSKPDAAVAKILFIN